MFQGASDPTEKVTLGDKEITTDQSGYFSVSQELMGMPLVFARLPHQAATTSKGVTPSPVAPKAFTATILHLQHHVRGQRRGHGPGHRPGRRHRQLPPGGSGGVRHQLPSRRYLYIPWARAWEMAYWRGSKKVVRAGILLLL